MRNRLFLALGSIAILLVAAVSSPHAAGLPTMGPPIPTTIIVTKPAPGETFGNKTVVTMGVGAQTYKFILKDAYTNHLRVRWPDIWQYVMQYNPNFVVQGPGADTFAKVQPGQTLTVEGAFAPLDRTLEVLNVERSGGDDKHY